MRRFALLLFLMPLALFAQIGAGVGPGNQIQGRGGRGGGPPQPPPPPTPLQDLATMEGQVFNAATGEPLRKATINMNRSENGPIQVAGPRSFSAMTDASGKFVVTHIEPGQYRINCNHTGFLDMQYNARRPGGPGTNLELQRAQHMTGVVFRLSPHGVISGKIVDEDGDPLENVQMQLMRIVYSQGKRQLQQADNENTNDLGEFRIAGVSPGKYYLGATYRNRRPMVMSPGSEQEPQLDYAPTFYPGVTDITSAAPIEMKPAAQLQGINIRMTRLHTVHVRGRVTNNLAPDQPPQVQPAPNGRGGTITTQDGIVITMPNLPNLGAAINRINIQVHLQPRGALTPAGTNLNGQVRPDGTFDFASVPPGAYTLIAAANQGAHPHSARQNVDVGNTDLDNIHMSINPGLTVSGLIRVDGQPTEAPPLFNVRLTPRSSGAGVGAPQPAKADAGGAFKMEDINPDLYNVTVTPMPQGYYIKSSRAGQRDVMAAGLDLTNGSATLEVILSPNAPQVTGSVQNPNTNNAAVAVTVVLIPQEPERKEQSYYYTQTTSDQFGRFTFNRVVPGEYRAYAFEDVENGAWYDPDFMKSIASKGESLSVREGSPSALSLTMIAAK